MTDAQANIYYPPPEGQVGTLETTIDPTMDETKIMANMCNVRVIPEYAATFNPAIGGPLITCMGNIPVTLDVVDDIAALPLEGGASQQPGAGAPPPDQGQAGQLPAGD